MAASLLMMVESIQDDDISHVFFRFSERMVLQAFIHITVGACMHDVVVDLICFLHRRIVHLQGHHVLRVALDRARCAVCTKELGYHGDTS